MGDLTDAGDVGVVRRAGPAHEAHVDGPHGVREPLDGVVAEAKEVGAHLRAIEGARRTQALELADRAFDEHEVEASPGADPRLLVGRER